jgi:uncharacterized protein YggT (Ycf19 family)
MFLFRVLNLVIGLYETGLLIYILCSWIVHPTTMGLRRGLAPAYEPLLIPIRRLIPLPRFGNVAIDLSPIVLFIAIGLVRSLVFSIFW